MTRRRKQSKRRRGELFVGLEFWEMETEAFQHLSADATRVYLFMRKRYNGANNGRVIFSWRDAMAVLRSGSDRAGKALRELRQKGFVKLRTPGAPGPAIRPAGEWQLTVFECGGQPASKDFAHWRPDSEKQLPTPETGTRRTQNRCADSEMAADLMPKTPESAPETGAPSADEHTQNRYTCRSTSKGGLSKSESDSESERADHRRPPDGGRMHPHGLPPCPRCGIPALQTRTRSKRPNRAPIWHSQWLVCAVCSHSVFDKAHEETGDEACAAGPPSSPAAPSAGSAGMVWRKPTYIELPALKKRVPRNSGTASVSREPPQTNGPRFGKWLVEEGLRRNVPPDYVADVLGIALGDLIDLTDGKTQWTKYHRARVIDALEKYRPNEDEAALPNLRVILESYPN
jgi:hypothetical protein